MSELTGPELFESAIAHLTDVINPPSSDQNNDEFLKISQVYATQANTAAIVLLAGIVADAANIRAFELDAWAEVIPAPPLKECKGQELRRPACTERHTNDCAYTDPVPEPKHELLPVGTRVLVSEKEVDREGKIRYHNPVAGRISGYDMHRTKYRWQTEFEPGRYASHDYWAFVGNSVQVHPDGPECPSALEPPSPRIYVQNLRGKQGHIQRGPFRGGDGKLVVQVQWHAPGAQPVWVGLDVLQLIASTEVERCPNGQTGDDCGSGENQCELCLQAEDAEADDIERSMGL